MRGYKINIDVVKNNLIRRIIKFKGMDISIETDKGEVRHWYDPHNGEHGSTTMKYPYGYIRRTVGEDDEQIDCYVGPDKENTDLYVIHQMSAPDFDDYDEDKVMIGFESPRAAKAAYLQHYSDERFFGSMETIPVEEFKDKFIEKSLLQKNLPGRYMGAVIGNPKPKNPNNPWENNDNSIESQPQALNMNSMPNMQMMPQMPGMMPGMGMMQMGPPPLDVETAEGVEDALKRAGAMKDPELLRLTSKIWGDGYQFIEATSDHVRAEVIGFLLDQRDLLNRMHDGLVTIAQLAQPEPPSMTTPNEDPLAELNAYLQGSENSGSSSQKLIDGNQNTINQSSAGNSNAQALDESSSLNLQPGATSSNTDYPQQHTQ